MNEEEEESDVELGQKSSNNASDEEDGFDEEDDKTVSYGVDASLHGSKLLDSSSVDLFSDLEVDGYTAVCAGDKLPWSTEFPAKTIFRLSGSFRDKILTKVPYKIQKNAVFAICTKSLRSAKDLVSDSNGRWENMHGKRFLPFVYLADEDDVYQAVDTKEGTQFSRAYWKCHSEKDYKRVIFDCPKLQIALLQYYFSHGEERSFEILPHANSKRDGPYERLRDSTRQRIAVLADQGKNPRQIKQQLVQELGGPAGLDSTAGVPSMRAIYNHLHNDKPTGMDDFNGLILRCINEAGTTKMFVRQVEVAPSFRVMLANERQLNDLVRFARTHGFSMDTTFNIGDYLATVVVFRHMMLNRRLSGTHPVMVGPVFLHKLKDMDTYKWMGAQLLHARPALRKAKYFGTDGDSAMYTPMQELLPESMHILCMLHFIDTMIRKMVELGMSAFRSVVLGEVLGKRVGDQRTLGFVDCRTAEEYDKATQEICDMIKDLHVNGQILADYFRDHKAPQIRLHYTVAAQEAAGLAGAHYNTNAVESINALIKKDVLRKRSPLEFAKDLKEIIDGQTKESEFAMISKGELELTPAYKHLAVPFKRHSTQTAEQRTVVLSRIHSEPFDPNKQPLELIELLQDSGERLRMDQHGAKLAEIESVGPDMLLEMLEGARGILRIKNPVAPSPGPDETRFRVIMLNSATSVEIVIGPEKVQCHKECYTFKLYGICSETIAVAIHQTQLDNLVHWAKSDRVKNATRSGLYQVTRHNAPAHAGRKPHGTNIRKGPASRRDPVTGILDTTSGTTVSQPPGLNARKRGAEEPSCSAAHQTPPTPKAPTYDPIEHEDQLWSKIQVQALATKPQPNPAEYEIWFLDLCDSRTTKCSGCERNFRKGKDGIYPEPPNDMLFVTCGKRKYQKKGEGTQVSLKPGNIYFHVHKSCLADGYRKVEISAASDSTVVTSAEIKQRISLAHEARLWAALA